MHHHHCITRAGLPHTNNCTPDVTTQMHTCLLHPCPTHAAHQRNASTARASCRMGLPAAAAAAAHKLRPDQCWAAKMAALFQQTVCLRACVCPQQSKLSPPFTKSRTCTCPPPALCIHAHTTTTTTTCQPQSDAGPACDCCSRGSRRLQQVMTPCHCEEHTRTLVQPQERVPKPSPHTHTAACCAKGVQGHQCTRRPNTQSARPHWLRTHCAWHTTNAAAVTQ